MSATYRRLLRREVVDICVLIFIADVVTGVQTPLFSLYTTSLGASLGLLGLITAVLGLTRLVSALPLGMLSDRLDRKTVLVGGMIAFEMVGGLEAAGRLCESLRLAWIAASLGGTHTLVAHPASTTHRQVDADTRRAQGIADGLIRLSVGLEDTEDLLADFRAALPR